MDSVSEDEPNFCFACCSLPLVADHVEASCPLLAAAKSTCECRAPECSLSAPRCERKLFVLLVCVQLYECMLSHGLTTVQALAGKTPAILMEELGARRRFWGDSIPSAVFDTFVRIDVAQAAPVPVGQWHLRQPLMLVASGRTAGRNLALSVVEPPLPLVASATAVVAAGWLDLLRGVARGAACVVRGGQLVPSSFRQHISLHTRPGGQLRWTPVLMHPKRGFLLEKGPQRRWKLFSELSPAKILDYEARLSGNERVKRGGGYMVDFVEMADSADAGDEAEVRRRGKQDSVGEEPPPSAETLSWYKAFSRGLAESDGEDEGGGSESSREGGSGGEDEDEPDGDGGGGMKRGLEPTSADATATGSYRDQLALFAAQYAREQAQAATSGAAAAAAGDTSLSALGKKQEAMRQLVSRKKLKTGVVNAGARIRTAIDDLGDATYEKMGRVCKCRGVYMIPMLAIVSGVMALVGVALEYFPQVATTVLLRVAHETPLMGLNWVLYLLWMFGFSAVAVFLTLHMFPVIAGSGIPEVRSILSGSTLPQYLKRPVFPAKLIGTLAMASSGLWVGKEGPSVHLACLLGWFVVRSFPVFEKMRENRTLYRWLLSSCSALGPAAVFGSPIGGVLFAIEATASYFSVTELFYAFMAAVPAALIVRLLLGYTRTLQFSFLPITQVFSLNFVVPDAGEFFWAMFMAVLLGLLGPLFIELSSQIVRGRRWLFARSPLLGSQQVYFFFVVILSSVLFFPDFIGTFMNTNALRVLQALSSPDQAELIAEGWLKYDIRGSCALFFFVKSVMLALIVSFPAPTGIFLPTLASGAAFGRMWGEIYAAIVPTPGGMPSPGLNPWGFAFIGSACMGSSVTHTISAAVIVLEVIGQGQLLIPVLCGAVVSFTVSRLVTGKVGIFERIAFDRRLPFLYELPLPLYGLRAADLMVPIDWSDPAGKKDGHVRVIENMSTLEAFDAILDHDFNPAQVFPVVESFQSQMLMGFVRGLDLVRYRTSIYRKLELINYSTPLPPEALQMSSLNLLPPKDDDSMRRPQWGRASRRNVTTARNILQSVQESVAPLRVTKVHLVVSPSSPVVFIHQLMSLNGPKADVIPVSEKGRLLGLIFRADLILRLTPKRFVPAAVVAAPVLLVHMTRAPMAPVAAVLESEQKPPSGGGGAGGGNGEDELEEEFAATTVRVE
jgi:H+/Cl- antiporter ClcA/CBS domain-containing protein